MMDTDIVKDENELKESAAPAESPENSAEVKSEGILSVDHNGTEELKEDVKEPVNEPEQLTKEPAAETEAEEYPVADSALPVTTPKDDNISFLNTQVEKLIGLKDEKNFTDFWFYVRELNKMVFTLKGIAREERLKFKERIGELCDETKKLQDEWKEKISKTSSLKLERISRMVEEALSFGTSHEELEKSFHKIEAANKFFREGKVANDAGEETAEMSREDREKAKELIKAGKDKVLDRKREIREANFKVVTQKLNAISDSLIGAGKPQKIFDAIKKLRLEMKDMTLDRPQLREIDNVIETMWKKAREKSSFSRVHDTQMRIRGLEDSLRRKEHFIHTLEKEIKDLGAKWNNVKNDFFKNRVNEWAEEKKQKIESTRKEIEGVKEKITFLQEQLKRN